jgi:hypothetical protein
VKNYDKFGLLKGIGVISKVQWSTILSIEILALVNKGLNRKT